MSVTTLDFETFYDKDYSLSKMTTEEYINDPRFEIIMVSVKKDNERPIIIIADSLSEYKEKLKPYIDGNVCIAHNAMFDMGILSFRLGLHPAMIVDTLSMARPHHGSTVGGSLKSLAEIYGLGVKGTEVTNALGKRRLDFTGPELLSYAGYCMNDVQLTYDLFKKLRPLTPNSEMMLIDKTIRMFTEPKLELDKGLLAMHLDKVRTEKQALLDKVSLDRDVVMSNPKFAELLRIVGGVEPPMKISARTGKSTYAFSKTDEEFTALLEHPDPVVQALVATRLGVKSTIEETRTEMFLDIARRSGRLPIPLSYSGAVTTMRWSGTNKINLQNLPRGGALRHSIVAPSGYVVVACDSSNIELRVVHTLAGQQDTIEMLRKGQDLYCDFGTAFYGRTITKADVEERFLSKVAMLGLQYGMSAPKFKDTVRIMSKGKTIIEDSVAENVVALFRSKYHAIPALWKQADKLLEAIIKGADYEIGGGLVAAGSGKIKTKPEHQIYYPNLRAEGRELFYDTKKFKTVVPTKIYGGKCVENLAQHLSRNIIAEQWLTISSRYPVVLQVHDEIVFLVPEAEAEEAREWAERVMSTPPSWWPDIPLAAEASYGKSYGDAK